MDRVAELQAQQACVDEKLALLKKQAKAAKQKQKDLAKKAKKLWQLTPFMNAVALIVYVLAGYTAIPAARYLMAEAARRKWPEKSEEELRRLVEDVFLNSEETDIACLCDLARPRNAKAAKAAVRWTEEWRLAVWVEDLNLARGVAPPTDAVLERFEQQRRALPESVRPTCKGVADEARARMWASRWRRRWGGKHGRIRPKDEMTAEEKRAKARAPELIQIPCGIMC